MNILHLMFSFRVGGAELMLIDIINQQARTNKTSLIIVNNIYEQHLLDQLDSSVKVYYIERPEGSYNPIYYFHLNRLAGKIQPDVIHCHNASMISLLRPSLRKKTVLTVHTTNTVSNAFNKYKALFAISNAVKRDIKNRYNLDSIVVYNGLDTERVKQTPKQRKRYKGEFKIVQVGRLDHQVKGQHLIIEAVSKLPKELRTSIQLFLIGDGASLVYLEELTKQLQVDQITHFLGQKDREYILSNLNQYDLLVQPSINEGFGLSIAEAMLAKVPVLISNLEGPMEVISEGRFGSYFEANNIDSLVEQLIIFSKTGKEDIQKRIELAYDYANSNFNIKRTVQEYSKYYKLIAGYKSKGN